MSNGRRTMVAGNAREYKTTPQYDAKLCARYLSCKKDGHCKQRCSSGTMSCYKEPER